MEAVNQLRDFVDKVKLSTFLFAVLVVLIVLFILGYKLTYVSTAEHMGNTINMIEQSQANVKGEHMLVPNAYAKQESKFIPAAEHFGTGAGDAASYKYVKGQVTGQLVMGKACDGNEWGPQATEELQSLVSIGGIRDVLLADDSTRQHAEDIALNPSVMMADVGQA